jgi:hypothetical protein
VQLILGGFVDRVKLAVRGVFRKLLSRALSNQIGTEPLPIYKKVVAFITKNGDCGHIQKKCCAL